MKKLDKNQKIGIIALAIFVVFLIVFSVLSSLVQSGSIPDFATNQRVQGLLDFVMFSPLCIAMLLVESISNPKKIYSVLFKRYFNC